jgi:type II secretion system protein G
MLQQLRKGRDAGFTLIELLIVIVILGILAAIVVFAVGSASTDSKLSACQADKHTLSVAVEAYKAKIGSYPSAAQSSSSNVLVPDYIKVWPGGTNYTLTIPASSGTPAVGAGTGGAAAPATC